MNLSATKLVEFEEPAEGTGTTVALPETETLTDEADALTIGRPRAKAALDVVKEDSYSHCKQRISEDGRILVSRKAWVMRVVFLVGLAAFMVYGMKASLLTGDPLFIYSMFILIHSLLLLVCAWFGFKSRATGRVPDALVSVVIPVYNQQELIRRVVEAVFESTYPNLEVIAVNDGSNDNTGEVLDALASKNPKLKVIHKPNGGKRTAVATGFYASEGEFVVLVDSDSIVDKQAIEEFMKVFSANPRVGGVVANGRVLNAAKNVLTRCQNVWYDTAFNIHKTAESCFGTVLCLSGCLSAYRREAIARFIPFWAEDWAQYSDDRSLTTYAIATAWAKTQFAPVERQLMRSMAGYDDAEDRALTCQALKEWETVYVPTAVVHTEVPERFSTYIKQQLRWRKGYLRVNFFASAFFWRKNPVMALMFYMDLTSVFIFPAVAFSTLFYRPFFLGSYLFLLTFLLGQLLIGLVLGLDYKFRDPSARYWSYRPLMNLMSVAILSWLLLPALWGFRKKGWLTR